MADEETVNLLRTWDVKEEIVQRFQANEIFKKKMHELTPDAIKELIPEVGPRMSFLSRWREMFPTEKRKRDQYQDDSDDTASVSSSDSEAHSNSSLPAGDNSCALKRDTCFVGKEMYKRLRRPDVEQILNDSEQGRRIVQGYKNLTLTKVARDNVIEIIISHLFNVVKGRCSKDDFYDIAKGIVKVFPKETFEIYFVPPVSKKDSSTNKSVSVRGKLAVAYNNRLQRTKRALHGCCKNQADASNDTATQAAEDPSTKESIAWLETNQEPWDVVQGHWTVTAKLRLNDIRTSESGKIEETLKKWPILRHPKGWLLIRQDFEKMKLSTVVEAISRWPIFFKRIQAVCPNKQRKLPRMQNLQDMLAGVLTDDAKAIIQLALLPYLIPPKGRVSTKNKGHWKPSMAECEESLVVHIATANDISRIRDERIKTMQKLGLTVQPYVIAVGSDLSNINTYFVSMDSILYSVTSAFEAIDTCFKIFHVLHAAYPPASEHLWYLIQRELYQFSTKYDKKAPCILEVIAALNALNSDNEA